MKNITNKEFEINKTTMRDLTPYEMDEVAGGSRSIICPFPTITLTTLTTTTITTPVTITITVIEK
jgi:hypothetical protein